MLFERLGVLASGRGSNFQAILDHIKLGVLRNVEADVLISNNPDAQALRVANQYGIPYTTLEPKRKGVNEEFDREIYKILEEYEVSLVILAGYMQIISPYLIKKYEGRMMNIHPSLLPSFKGLDAQKRSLEHGIKVAGCTVHYATEDVDFGPIILQHAVPVREDDTGKTLSKRILIFEHRLYSKAIQLHADGRLEVEGRRTKINYSDNWEEKWDERQRAFIEYQKKA